MNYDEQWIEFYELAKKYYNHYKNLNVPLKYRTLDGINYYSNGLKLGKWISEQRQLYEKGKLSKEQIDKLNQIGMIWNISEYQLINKTITPRNIKDVKRIIKRRFTTFIDNSTDIEFHDKEDITQLNENFSDLFGDVRKNQYKRQQERQPSEKESLPETTSEFDEIKISSLNVVDKKSSLQDNEKRLEEQKNKKAVEDNVDVKPTLTWDEYYELAKKYCEYHKHLNVPLMFKTKNGAHFDSKGFRLGRWIDDQRELRSEGKLSKEQIDKLNQIGMIWHITVKSSVETKWDERYKLAKKYYSHYGHLRIPYNFNTKDGIHKCKDDDSIKLGSWIVTQRRDYKNGNISKEKIDMLNKIKMVWDVPEYYFINKNITPKNREKIEEKIENRFSTFIDEKTNTEFNSKEDITKLNEDFSDLFGDVKENRSKRQQERQLLEQEKLKLEELKEIQTEEYLDKFSRGNVLFSILITTITITLGLLIAMFMIR